MPHLPAFCDTCGTAFPSGLYFENSRNVTVTGGGTSGPCPKCGGMGRISNGVFNFVDDTIEILSAAPRTVDELLRLSKILQEAKSYRQRPDHVARRIKSELPSLAALAELLPTNRADLYAFLALILALVQLVAQQSSNTQTPVSITVEQVVQQVLVAPPAAATSSPRHPSTSKKAATKKIGRNDPCPCNSGRKYKKCHGAPT